ncbi:MAG: TetR/AcrR family transcriptional regulator, partial [Gammaproteobacteria bacterium]|nr:TetR/AcrR family transcriptional regulator [Gammaproteobacteria bacterium]
QRASMRRTGTATYATGQETAQRILDVARRLFMEEGHSKLTMRRIAKAAGMSPGNLSYYYPTRADLLADLLQYVIDGYIRQFETLRDEASDDADEQFCAVLGFVFNDLGTRETTLFFPELWVLANRDDWIAQQMEKMYAQYRAILVDVIGLVNPSLGAARKADLALMISASIEGHTVFVGHGRPHRARGAQLRDLLIDNFLKLVKQSGEPSEVERATGQ